MKIYRIDPNWTLRTPDGNRTPIAYSDTRLEAKALARRMTAAAAMNPNLAAIPEFVATVSQVDVSERFGKGRRFVVAILNGEHVLAVSSPDLDVITRKAASVRCSACGNKDRAQAMNPTPEGVICAKCFEDRYLFEGPHPTQSEEARAAFLHEQDHGPEVRSDLTRGTR